MPSLTAAGIDRHEPPLAGADLAKGDVLDPVAVEVARAKRNVVQRRRPDVMKARYRSGRAQGHIAQFTGRLVTPGDVHGPVVVEIDLADDVLKPVIAERMPHVPAGPGGHDPPVVQFGVAEHDTRGHPSAPVA